MIMHSMTRNKLDILMIKSDKFELNIVSVFSKVTLFMATIHLTSVNQNFSTNTHYDILLWNH